MHYLFAKLRSAELHQTFKGIAVPWGGTEGLGCRGGGGRLCHNAPKSCLLAIQPLTRGRDKELYFKASNL